SATSSSSPIARRATSASSSTASPGTPCAWVGTGTHYHLKNNDTLASPIFHGYKLSGPTPFAIIEAGVGDTGGFDHDVLWANQAGVCLSIALGIIDFLNGN